MHKVRQRSSPGSYASDYVPVWAGLASSAEAAVAGLRSMHKAGDHLAPCAPHLMPHITCHPGQAWQRAPGLQWLGCSPCAKQVSAELPKSSLVRRCMLRTTLIPAVLHGPLVPAEVSAAEAPHGLHGLQALSGMDVALR